MKPPVGRAWVGALVAPLVLCASCSSAPRRADSPPTDQPATRFAVYSQITLTSDLSVLSPGERAMLPHLFAAARAMDTCFWQESYGDRAELMGRIDDPALRQHAEINYGPWDRLDGNKAFVAGFGDKPLGASFYPADVTKAEIEEQAAANPALKGLYTMVRRGDDGKLKAVPYHEHFEALTKKASHHLSEAAKLADDAGLKRYLELRAKALLEDDFAASDMAWLDMKTNTLDVVIGPIETYEDALFGYKAAHGAYILVKDRDWSDRLTRYVALLPALQTSLPVDARYKAEKPGLESDLGAYDVIFYAGDSNAGSKTIAVNLPNDPDVQLEKGTRRLQLKNAMRAKYDRILVPIAGVLIDEAQRKHVTFDAFFANTMFHEVAHGLGIKETLTGKGDVRTALQDVASTIEEGKADILGLHMVTQLREQGELTEGVLADNQVTFMAGIFRSIRFGAASAHGRANLIRFNYFRERGAFARDEATGTYRVDADAFRAAMTELSRDILVLQGDGDLAAVRAFVARYGVLGDQLAADLARLETASIPTDIVFEQGPEVVGVTPLD